MDDFTMHQLQAVRDPKEKAAIIAEYFFDGLPIEVALVARYCVLFHWFDQIVVEALLKDITISKSNLKNIYEQLVALPFIERLPWGQKFQDLTREGLLARYIRTDPKTLKDAARLAAHAYEIRDEDKKVVAEALFCHIIAGNQQKSRALLDMLQEDASKHEDWHYLSNLLRMQEEAEDIPFVQPLPLSELDWMVRGSTHQFQKRFEEAINDYNNAIAHNPQNAFAYANRGTTYSKQEQYEKAISDYNHAIQLDATLTQVYINRGLLAKKQGRYTAALEDLELALQQDPQNTSIWCDKGSALSEFSLYEEALAAYEEALRLDPQNVNIYKGKGIVFNSLGRYEEALAAYEEALRLDPQNSDIYRGKGAALYGLKSYIQASIAYDEAFRLDPYTTDQFNERTSPVAAQGIEQQHIPHEEKNNLKNEELQIETNRQRFTFSQRLKGLHLSPVSFNATQKQKKKRQPITGSRTLENIGALAAVASIILIASLLFHFTASTIVGSGKPWATATAQTLAHATAQAQMTATAQACLEPQAPNTRLCTPIRTQATTTTIQNNPYPSYLPGNGQLALYDPMKDGSRGYGWLPTGQTVLPTSKGNCAFKKGGLDASVNGDENYLVYFHPCITNHTNFSDFAYEVSMTLLAGDCGGITLRGRGDLFYYFLICRDGRYRIVKYTGDPGVSVTPTSGVNPILKDASSQFIAMNLNNTNLISVWAKGSTMNFYVNRQLVDSIQDSKYATGQIGVLAKSWNLNTLTEAVFNDARVWTLLQ